MRASTQQKLDEAKVSYRMKVNEIMYYDSLEDKFERGQKKGIKEIDHFFEKKYLRNLDEARLERLANKYSYTIVSDCQCEAGWTYFFYLVD